MRITRTVAWAAAMAALALTVSACSSDDGSTPEETTALSAEAQEALDAAYAGFGSDLSGLAPAEPEPGLSLYVMSCGESSATCAGPAAAMVEAAEAAGWTGTIVDGKLNPEGFATAIRQAVAADADVLVPVGISCSTAAAAFAEAKAAGVVIVGGGGVDDCDPQGWDSDRIWLADPPSPTGMFGALGMLQADYVFGQTNGNPQAVVINLTSNPWGQLITDAFDAQLGTLGAGQVLETVNITDVETADGSFIQKVTSALLANPDANSLIVPIDALLVNGLAAAIDQAGLADQLVVVGNFGSEAALEMIRAGQPGITAVIATAQDWEAWGSIDTAIRVMDGQDVVQVGYTIQAVDADHNMPESGKYNGSIDWMSAYLESWGR